MDPPYTHFPAEVCPQEQAVDVDTWKGEAGQCQETGNLKGMRSHHGCPQPRAHLTLPIGDHLCTQTKRIVEKILNK